MAADIEFLPPIAGAVLAVIFFSALSISGRKQGLELLRRWAEGQGFVLVSARRKSFVPHWQFTSAKGYQFFRVTVRNGDGTIRKSWIRCSDFTYRDPTKLDVIWDDELAKQKGASRP